MLDKDFFTRLAQSALEQMPPEDRFSQEDAEVLLRHRDLLASLGEELVQAFYNALFAHPTTRAVFREGERPKREETLRTWWRRTLEGPFDLDYWAWQARVGLIHLRRGVTNPMMLGHAAFVARFVGERVAHVEEGRLAQAVSRLMATVSSLIAQGYNEVFVEAARSFTGQSRKLLERTVTLALEGVAGRRG